MMYNDTPQHSKDEPQIVSCQSIGLVRSTNEDSIYTYQGEFALAEELYPYSVAVVADGLGGHVDGEKASAESVEIFMHSINQFFSKFSINGDRNIKGKLLKYLEELVQDIHYRIRTEIPGSGTTLTTAIIFQKDLYYCHIGDTRLYTIDNSGVMKLLTDDHTYIREILRNGNINENSLSRYKHMLTQAVGVSEQVSPHIGCIEISDIPYALLCSDGLWGEVSDNKMLNLILDSGDLQEKCDSLCEKALAAGGHDNISVILVNLT